MLDTNQLIDLLQQRGMEELKKYYGVYRGSVTDINDPEERGRVKVKVPIMGHLNPINVWVEPSFPGASKDRGMFWPPEVGDPVRVTFDRGDSGQPILYISGWYGKEDHLPEEFAYSANGRPEKKGFITRLGHRLIFSDKPGEETVHLSCHFPDSADPALTDVKKSSDRSKGKISFIDFSKNGIVIINQNGSLINLDAENNALSIIDENGNAFNLNKDGVSIIDKGGQTIFMDGTSININSAKDVTVSASSVNINSGSVFLGKGAVFSNVLGELLLTWLNTHTHLTVGPPGSPVISGTPVSPPIIPATPALLSNKVKTG